MGVMVAPLSLPVIGNSAGMLGTSLLWSLPVVAMLNLLTIHRYVTFILPQNAVPSEKHPTSFIQTIIKILQLSALVPFCIAASTLILASSGYTFNETFVRWFPNLLFSVCFLIFILSANIAGEAISKLIHNIAILLFAGSMMLLIGIGLLALEGPLFENINTPSTSSFNGRSFFMLFWLFMAAELAIYHNKQNGNQQTNPYSMFVAFIAAFLIFLLWGVVSMATTPLETLAESTGPQSVTAHLIAGATGRKIIGVALLSGSYAAVNMLLLGTSAVLGISLQPAKNQTQLFGKRLNIDFKIKWLIFFLSILVLIMLLSGMAGKEITFTLKRGAFYIWLIVYAAFNLAVLEHQVLSRTSGKAFLLANMAASVIYITAFIILISTDPETKAVIAFISVFVVVFALITIAGRYLTKHPY